MPLFNEQQNRAYFRQKNLPKKDKQDLILENLMQPKPEVQKMSIEGAPSERAAKFFSLLQGERGEALKWEDLTEEQKAELRPRTEELLTLIQPLIPQVRDGIDGLPGKNAEFDEDRLVEKVLSKIKIPIVKDGKNADPINTEDIVKRSVKEIKEFFIEEDRKMKRKLGPMMGGGTLNVSTGGGGSTTIQSAEIPDGTNTVFTFSKKPILIIAGNASYQENDGWTWDGISQATFTVPPYSSTVKLLALT